jgi:parallel beta-helix repeat protein
MASNLTLTPLRPVGRPGTAPVFNVKDYGAKGDGVTDDTAAIQAAFSAVGAGATVHFPDGVFVTSADLTLPAGAILDGLGVLKAKAGFNGAVLRPQAGSTVRNITIDGNRANVTASSGIALGGNSVTVEGVTVRACTVYGIVAFSQSGMRIVRNKVTDTGQTGIFFAAPSANYSNVLIESNEVDRSGEGAGVAGAGIQVIGLLGSYHASDIRISLNRVVMPANPTADTTPCIEHNGDVIRSSIVGNSTSGGAMGISVGRGKFCTVSANTVYRAKFYGLELGASEHCVLSGNTIEGDGFTQRGIAISATSGGNIIHNTVQGNTVKGCTTFAFSAANTPSYLTITGNTFLHSAANYCLVINGGSYVTITGNTFNGAGSCTKAIVLETTDRATINGNTIHDFTQNSLFVWANSAVTLDHISFCGNVCLNVGSDVATSLSGGATLAKLKVMGQVGSSGDRERLDFVNDVSIRVNTAAPEGVWSAGVGSIFMRRNGGAGTTLYVKESGTGNTGWVAK